MAQQAQPIVRGFLGENRLLADDLLADNISPDAENVDYSSGTIKKRKGFTKIHREAIYSGGIHIENVNNNRCVRIPEASQLDLVGDFTVEMFFTLLSEITTTERLIEKDDSGTTSGWVFFVIDTSSIRFRKRDSGGTARDATITSSDFVPLQVGERYHLIGARTGTTMRIRIARLSDGTAATATITCSGDTNNSRDLYVGADAGSSPGAADIDYIVDELRLWDTERTDAELAETRYRELNEEEVLNANLVGYWKMNEGSGNIVEDISITRNHGSLFQSGASPMTVEGLIPEGGQDDFAIRSNGQDQGGTLAYRSDFAPILDTGNDWVVEAWLRLDSSVGISDSRFLALGDFNDNSVFTIYVDSNLNLFYSYSTTTTHSNATRDTGYDVIVGQPFHVALIRAGGQERIFTLINGVLVDTHTGVTTENGPHSLTTTGLTLAHMLNNGTAANFCPCTIDEVRVWSTVLSPATIALQWQIEGPFHPALEPFLESHLHFNAGAVTVDERDVDAVVTFLPAEDKPTWTRGLVYPLRPEALQLAAPLTRHVGGDDVSSGQSRLHQEILVATRTDFWTIQGTQRTRLDELVVSNAFDNRYAHALYRNLLVVVNGLGRNYRYDGKAAPLSITLPTWTDTVTVAASAGSGWPLPDGDYKYRFAWYDNVNGIEGLFGGEQTVTLATASHDEVDISDIAASLAGYANVTHVRIYRQNPSSTVFRFHSDVAIGTTTATDDGTDDLQGNDAANTRRGHPNPHRICAVYSNRLFLGNESDGASSSKYSDPNTENFPGTNEFKVDENDGDELTGYASHFGGLVHFKQNSIHFLTGYGETTFQLVKLLDGIGCVSHNSIATAPGGIYFLAEDGVYLFDGRSARYLSHSQQPEFQKLDRTLARNAVGVYDISTHQYIVSFNQAPNLSRSFVDVNPGIFDHYWKLDNASLVDSSGSATLTAAGGPTGLFDGQRGAVTSFDGSGDEMSNTTDIAPSGEVYVYGLWFFLESLPASIMDIMGVEQSGVGPPTPGHFVDINADGLLTGTLLPFAGGGHSVSVSANAGQWNHCVFFYQGGVGDVAGVVLNGQVTFAASPPTASDQELSNEVIIGQSGAPGGLRFQGLLANIFVKHGAVATDIFTLGQIRRIYEYEKGGFVRATFAFDEETQAWAKWDKDFDTLVLAEHTSRQNDVLAGRNGFVNKLLHSDRDGAGFISGGPMNGSGTLSSEAGPLITDASAVFATAGDGLAGVQFVAVPSDTTLATQRRTILYNTATVLHLDSPLLPAVSGTYYIGPIDLHWESRWMDMGDPAVQKQWFRFGTWVKEHAATITFKHKTNTNETWTTTTFSTADEWIKFVTNNQGLKLKVRFEHIATDETLELQSFLTIFEPGVLF